MRIYSILAALLVTCSGLVSTEVAQAQSRKIDLDFESDGREITQAVGLLISPNRTVQKPEVTLSEMKDGHVVASFRYATSEVAEDTVATAVATRSDGSMVFANVRPLVPGSLSSSLLNIKACPSEVVNIDPSRNEVLRRLVDVQLKRRELFRQKLSESLTPEMLERLGKLERGFGLERSSPLTASLSPIELIDRLSRIETAIKGNLSARQLNAPRERR